MMLSSILGVQKEIWMWMLNNKKKDRQIWKIRRFTEELFQKKSYLILLMTQCMVHCVQFLYKILIFNPFTTQGVEILPAFAFKVSLV